MVVDIGLWAVIKTMKKSMVLRFQVSAWVKVRKDGDDIGYVR